jgi:tetratricopeptide (TPR) repeat protein
MSADAQVHATVISPTLQRLGLVEVFADAELPGFGCSDAERERLRWCEIAVIDIAGLTPDCAFELGFREASKPGTTVRFDSTGSDRSMAELEAELELALAAAASRNAPLATFLGDWTGLSHAKTDVFRDQVPVATAVSNALAIARRNHDSAAVEAVAAALGQFEFADNASLIDVMLSYRAVGDDAATVALVESFPALLAGQQMVREQYAFALNRVGRADQAEAILLELMAEHGNTPENCALLGRVYKDRGERTQAIDTYIRGFESDWRDAFPGINALTQMYMHDASDARIAELYPVIAYAVRRKIAAGAADYWDYATQVELAVMIGDETAARQAVAEQLVAPLATEAWMFASSARTLVKLANAGAPSWAIDLAATLRDAGAGLTTGLAIQPVAD